MNAAVNAFTLFPGNFRVSFEHADSANTERLALIDKAVNYDGDAHGSAVNGAALSRLHYALRSHKAEAWVPVVENAVGGATIGFSSVLTKWEGGQFVHYPAVYSEDTSVFADISKSFRDCTKWVNKRGVGLGTWFEHECIRRWTQNAAKDSPYGMVPAAIIGEFRPEGEAIVSILTKLGARLGTAEQGIKEVDGRDVRPAWDVVPEISVGEFYAPDGKRLRHIFPAYWSSERGTQQLCATFTEGVSSFTGPVVRVQLTSNGNLPEQAVLKDVLASLLAAGQKKIDEDKWGTDKAANESPLIRLGGSLRELQISAFSVAGDDLAQPRKRGILSTSLMRMHSFEPEIVAALPGYTRTLGPHAMRPVIVDFAGIPQDVLGSPVTPAKYLVVARQSPGLILH